MSANPTLHVRLQAIVLATLGQLDPFKLEDAVTPFGAAEVQQAVNKVNSLFAQAGIQFHFDPAKDLEGESSLLSMDDNPSDPLAREKRAALYQGKVVVYFRKGVGGRSEGSFVRTSKPDDGRLLTHELGHYFGLSHTHNEGMTLQGVVEAVKSQAVKLRSSESRSSYCFRSQSRARRLAKSSNAYWTGTLPTRACLTR